MLTNVVVVTGGAGALGGAVARELAGRGTRVALLDTPHALARGESLAASLGDGARAYAIDLAEAAEWDLVLPRVTRDLGAPTGAVLIAGGWDGGQRLAERPTDATYRAMLRRNLDTAYVSLRRLLPGLVAAGRGSVVVIGTRNVERPWEGAGAAEYTASKAAVVALAQAVAAEVVASGVRVNAVLPSTLDTEANRQAMPDADPARWVPTESCAKVIAFLLSDDARDVSGAALPVYGRV